MTVEIHIRGRSGEEAGDMNRLFQHVRQIGSDYRKIIVGNMVVAGMQMVMGENPSVNQQLSIPTFLPDIPYGKQSNTKYVLAVDPVIYERFCKKIAHPENKKQFATIVRVCCLLGYNFLNSEKVNSNNSLESIQADFVESPKIPSYSPKPPVQPVSVSNLDKLRAMGSHAC